MLKCGAQLWPEGSLCDTMALAFTTLSAARPSAPAPAAPAAAAPAAGTHGSGRGLVAAGLAACGLVAARERRQGKAVTSGSDSFNSMELIYVCIHFKSIHVHSILCNTTHQYMHTRYAIAFKLTAIHSQIASPEASSKTLIIVTAWWHAGRSSTVWMHLRQRRLTSTWSLANSWLEVQTQETIQAFAKQALAGASAAMLFTSALA